MRRIGNLWGGRVPNLLSCIDDRTRLTSQPTVSTGFRQRPIIPAKSAADEMSQYRRRDEPTKPKLMYVISEDWFFCSHFFERALAASDAGYDVVVLTRERAHGQKIRTAGIRLVPVNFSRRSINPVSELVSLLKIYLAYWRERPDLLHHVAAKAIFYGSLAALFFGPKPGIVNAPVGLGYVFCSRDWLARLLRPCLRLGYRLLLNPWRSRVIFENPDDAAYFVENGIVHPADTVVIRGAGIDVKRFQPLSSPPAPPVVVALVARMLRDKGVCEFVEAAHRLHEAGVAARPRPGEPDIHPVGAVAFMAWTKGGGMVGMAGRYGIDVASGPHRLSAVVLWRGPAEGAARSCSLRSADCNHRCYRVSGSGAGRRQRIAAAHRRCAGPCGRPAYSDFRCRP